MKKLVCLLLAVLLCAAVLPLSAAAESKYIDNSDLIPAYKPSEEVKQIVNGELWTPEWVEDIIIAEMRIETCTPEGTFQSAVKALDHYAETGVNCLWINPIYDRAGNPNDVIGANGYGNYGPHTVWHRLTGTTDYKEGFKVVKAFVDEAHKRGIRILFDVVTWGTDKRAPLYETNKEYYQVGYSVWGGWAYNWGGAKFKEWMRDVCVDLILNTGADGFRCDLEPGITGYSVFQAVRDKLEFDHGVKIAIMSESPNDRRSVYDFEQFGVGVDETSAESYVYYHNYFLDKMNIVESIRTGRGVGDRGLQSVEAGGQFTYYTFCLSNHDNPTDDARGNRVAFGYQAIFAPFIPLWYIGSEWNNPKTTGNVLFFNPIKWETIDEPENRAFFEDVKQMIRIRRSYPEIFSYWPSNHRETNICNVEVNGSKGALGDAYARYADGRGFVIVANPAAADLEAAVTVPLTDMGITDIKNATYTITEMMSGKRIKSGSYADIVAFTATVEAGEVAAFYIDYTTPPTTTTTTKTTTTTTTVPTTTVTEPTTTVTEPTTTVTEPTTTATTATTAPSEESSDVAGQETGAPVGVIIGIAVGAVVIIAAAVVLLLVLKKKKA